MFETINLFALSGLFITITSALMALVMLLEGQRALQRVWGIFCLAVFLWGLGAFMLATTANAFSALTWWKVAYVGVIFIPVLFVHFVYIFLNITPRLFIKVLYLISLFYLGSNLLTTAFIQDVHWVFNQFYYLSPTPLYNSFVAFFIFLTSYAHILLYKGYRHTKGQQRIQIEYFFVASLIGFVGGSFSFYPVYGVDFYPYLNFTVCLYPLIMGYAIFKHRLMNLRVIMTQLFVLSLWVFIFARVLLSPVGSKEQFVDIILLLLTVIIGVFLIRSVIKEIRQREHIEKLAKDLEAANERLKELDQLKSEFVSLATHQIRGPIAAIKGYASMMLEGDYGAVPEVCRKPVETILQSSSSLAGIVQDFLDVSRIEQGRMKYEFAVFNLSELLRAVSEELAPNIERKGLRVKLEIEDGIMVHADTGKMRQIVENLIDNAVKYTEQGTITITMTKTGEQALLKVADTGVGIAQETLPHLFKKFSRASDASKANLKGTGLGLYVAKQLVEAQGGKIWAESEGEGKGATFSVELPAFKK